MNDDECSLERKSKRSRSDSPIESPPAEDRSDSDTDSTSSSSSAFHALLLAETAAGQTIRSAVSLLFEPINADHRGSQIDFAAPVLAALASTPELADDLRTVARMCESIYQLARDNLTPGRKRLNLKLGNLTDVAHILENASNIVVLTGAGVSVSCGIPDFRSKGGLYDTVMEKYGLIDPQAIFDLEEFRMDPRLFYSFAKEVMPSKDLCPSPTHRFVAELERRGKLLCNYSQNIDGLERRAGVSEEKVVLCHGSFLTATCMRRTCRAKICGDEIAAEVAAGTVPTCRKCASAWESSAEVDDNMENVDVEAMGVLKPDIVFFGESLPKRVSANLEKHLEKADLLLVLGTSLQVAPIARIPKFFRDGVPRILVNRELVNYDFDIELLGDCDEVVRELRRVLGWCDPVVGVERREGTENGMTQKSEKCNGSAVTFRPPRRFLFPGAVYKAESDSDVDGMDESSTGTGDAEETAESGTTANDQSGSSGGREEREPVGDRASEKNTQTSMSNEM